MAMTAIMAVAGGASAALTWTEQTVDLGTNPGGTQMHGTAIVDLGARKFLYMVGGNTAGDGGDSRKIRYFEIVGSSVTSINTATYESPVNNLVYVTRSSVGYNGRLYIVGGTFNTIPGGVTYNGIRVFQPAANGDITGVLQEFDGSVATPALNRLEMSVAIKDSAASPATTGVIYIVAGGTTNVIQRAFIDKATGLVSGPVTQVGTLGASLTSVMVAVHNGYLYVMGGTPATNVVRYFQILANDDLGPENIATAPLPENRFDGGAASYNGSLFQVAGCMSSNADTRNIVYRATVAAGGNVTAWTLDTPVNRTPGARRVGVAADSSGMYLVGGRLDASAFSNKIDVGTQPAASVVDWSLY